MVPRSLDAPEHYSLAHPVIPLHDRAMEVTIETSLVWSTEMGMRRWGAGQPPATLVTLLDDLLDLRADVRRRAPGT